MSLGERFLFLFWAVIMQLVVVVPDTISALLGAVLAVLRSGPIRLQSQIIAVAIWDFPWADERLVRFITFQRYLGMFPTPLFGLCAVFDQNYRQTAFSGLWNLTSKAAISVSWQMLMHNWKHLLNLYFAKRIQRIRLTNSEVAEITRKYERLKCCKAYAYTWFETYKRNNRFGAQVSYHKQDHQDALNSLKWAAGIEEGSPSHDYFRSKSHMDRVYYNRLSDLFLDFSNRFVCWSRWARVFWASHR
uniref:C-like n=1 Tax=Nicotiana tomentosiformis TaxID=4098 RepID=A0A088F5Z5_NICTO|nr:C-like [Nicotiana tomentosiformis]